MHSRMRIVALAAVGALAVMLTPRAQADAWDQKIVFTFSGPVEIPGQVLSPGTYVFKLMNSMADRNVVQVFDNNETHCYGNFLAIPDYRMTPTSKPVITFEERAEGSPQAVKSWFYPGYNYGHEFVYHKAEQVASANSQAAGMAENTTATSAPAPPPVTEQAPQNETEQQQTETAQAMTPPPATEEANTPPPATEQANTPPPEEANRMTEQLPQTGSDLPLIGLVGMLSLASALVLRRVRAN
jgi:LPXTG-motif cell wall-anchored protein